MKSKINRLVVVLCCCWIVLAVCLRIFLLLSGKFIGAELGIHLLGLVFIAMFGFGLWAMVHNKSWGLVVFIVGMLGQIILGIIGDYPQIIEGNILAIVKVPLYLILAYFFVSFLHEDIKAKGKIT